MKTIHCTTELFAPLGVEEIYQTRGGSILASIVIAFALGAAGAAGAEIIGDWDNFKAGLAGRSSC